MTTSNLDNMCFSLHFNLIYFLKKLFISFLTSLEEIRREALFFNKFVNKVLSFECEG